MALPEKIEYCISRRPEFAGLFESDLMNAEDAPYWALSDPLARSSEMLIAGIPMHRGIKMTTLSGASILPTSPGHKLLYFCHGVLPGKIEKAIERPTEIQYTDFPGFSPADSSVETIGELGEILFAVNELAFQADEDEFGLMRPSYHAHRQCMRILLSLAQNGEFIKPSEIGTDRNGAIRIAWTGDGREVELVCPSEETDLPYIYFSSNDSYGTDPNANPEAVLLKVRWAKGGK